MRLVVISALVCLSIADPAWADVSVPSKIDMVTVFPSGAEVTRTIQVKLEPGEHALLIDDVTGQAVPASIRVEASATGKLEIGSVDARHVSLSSSDPAVAQSSRRKIEDQIEALSDSRAAQDDIIQAAEMQRAYLANLAKLPQTPGGPGAPREDWQSLSGIIGMGMGEAARNVAGAKLKQREIDRQIADLRKELLAAGGKFDDRIQVRIYVSAAERLETTLSLRYQVLAASWTPFYDARLATGDRDKGASPSLALTRRAIVSQTTGEDWNDVTLSLSTTRPGTSTAAPSLNMLSVDFTVEASNLPVSGLRKEQEPNQTTFRGPAEQSTETLEENRRVNVQPGRQPGREKSAFAAATAFQAVYGIPGRTTIKTTGEEKRLQIMAEDTQPALMVQTVPRFDHTAYLYARLTLPGASSPILPGLVSLFRDGVYVGMGELPQLSPGEDYDLGFGADERVKVKRVVTEDKKGDTGVFATSRVEERRYVITVKNLHTRAIEVQVIDRIPVPMHQDITVDFSTSAGPDPTEKDVDGKRGTLLWQMSARPGEEKQLAFGYRVTARAGKPLIYREVSDEETVTRMKSRMMH